MYRQPDVPEPPDLGARRVPWRRTFGRGLVLAGVALLAVAPLVDESTQLAGAHGAYVVKVGFAAMLAVPMIAFGIAHSLNRTTLRVEGARFVVEVGPIPVGGRSVAIADVRGFELRSRGERRDLVMLVRAPGPPIVLVSAIGDRAEATLDWLNRTLREARELGSFA